VIQETANAEEKETSDEGKGKSSESRNKPILKKSGTKIVRESFNSQGKKRRTKKEGRKKGKGGRGGTETAQESDGGATGAEIKKRGAREKGRGTGDNKNVHNRK